VVRVEFPKLNVNHVEVLVRIKVRIPVNVRLSFNVEQRPQDLRLLKLSKSQLVVALAICHVKHTVDHTE
jgi:hypothetical protein